MSETLARAVPRVPEATSPEGKPPKRRRLRRLVQVLAVLVVLVLVLLGAAGLWLRHAMVESLPQVEGKRAVAGLAAPVTISRDQLGVPTLRGASRRDVAFGTGFVHGQDRFFQMDLLRRRSAGELAELLGEQPLATDRTFRVHLFRARSKRLFENSPADIRALLSAYADGVNAGLKSLEGPPFEYGVLRQEPEPWRPEDSFLVMFSMFALLQDINGTADVKTGMMRDLLPAPLFEFLTPEGTEWDAPMVGPAFAARPIPGPGQIDPGKLRKVAALERLEPAQVLALLALLALDTAPPPAGSNGWAVAGSHTANGGALLANDPHLPLSVPNVWYRASFEWPREDGSGTWHRVTGATLPGAPAMVVGSNGQVAWGVTNSAIDASDIVSLAPDPRGGNRYLSPSGPRFFESRREVLRVKGGGSEEIVAEWTPWGPVVGKDHRGRKQVVHAVADTDEAANFEILRLETASGLPQALDIAHRSGVPAMNFIAADASGHIAWTIIGKVPRRAGAGANGVPASWSDGAPLWQGLLAPEEVPTIVDPASGRIWTANNRVVGGEMLDKLGRQGYVLGARARQIRDGLFALERATPADMLKVQLDDRAIFLERWQKLLLGALTPQALAADPRRRELKDLVEHWGGRAAVSSAGYRMVRSFRVLLSRDVFNYLTGPCREADPEFDYTSFSYQLEGPLWELASRQPPHLLNPKYKSWQEQFLAAADEVINVFSAQGPLRERTWGERNTTGIRHLLSPALPVLGSSLLDMPVAQIPGDEDMPRVQDTDYGSTLRMVVSPGREAEGLLHMPGGESGNPLSPHYTDAHGAWVQGAATPFLPGAPVHVLRLEPQGPKSETDREAK